MKANCSTLARIVKTIPAIFQPSVILADHTSDAQTSIATTGTIKRSRTTRISDTLRATGSLARNSSPTKQAVGLKNANSQMATLRGPGIEASILMRPVVDLTLATVPLD